MNIAEIENRTFEALKSLGCKTFKNIISIEPNTKLKTILVDPSYSDQKLHIFAWVICKFEPRFANELSNFDFLQPEAKVKKIVEWLNTLGIVDPVEFTSDRLLKTSERAYNQDLLHILDTLTDMIKRRMRSEQTDVDDLMAFHLNLSTTLSLHDMSSAGGDSTFVAGVDVVGVSSSSSLTSAAATSSGPALNQERLNKRVQLHADENYWREFQTLAKPHLASSIPHDMQRIIRTINERAVANCGADYQPLQITGKGPVKKDEILSALENRLSDLKEKIEFNKTILLSNAADCCQEGDLIEIDNDKMRENVFNQIENDINEANLYLNEFNRFSEINIEKSKLLDSVLGETSEELIEFDHLVDVEAPKTQLEASLGEFTDYYNRFKKIYENYINWSRFIQKKRQEQLDYEENCSLTKSNNVDRIIGSLEKFNTEIQDCMNMIGQNMIVITDKK